MDTQLQKIPIDSATRSQIIHQLWPRTPSVHFEPDDLDWDAYFAYYSDQCRMLNDTTISNHQDLVAVVDLLKHSSTKADLKRELQRRSPEVNQEDMEHVIEDTIVLVIRLFVMMEIGVPFLGYSGRLPLHWTEGSLQSHVHRYFSEPPVLCHEGVKLEPVFTARNIQRIAGFRIEWTSNLVDHLRMMESKDGVHTVAIFYHASFLRWHQR
jgi:hypothetical protein